MYLINNIFYFSNFNPSNTENDISYISKEMFEKQKLSAVEISTSGEWSDYKILKFYFVSKSNDTVNQLLRGLTFFAMSANLSVSFWFCLNVCFKSDHQPFAVNWRSDMSRVIPYCPKLLMILLYYYIHLGLSKIFCLTWDSNPCQTCHIECKIVVATILHPIWHHLGYSKKAFFSHGDRTMVFPIVSHLLYPFFTLRGLTNV